MTPPTPGTALASSFLLDATALSHAMQFQLAWGDTSRAIALLRKARDLDPNNLQTLSNLAHLDIDSGEIAKLKACLDQILRVTPPEKEGDALRFPAMHPMDPGRLQTAYLATVEQRNGRPSTEAMRAFAQLLGGRCAPPTKRARLPPQRHPRTRATPTARFA